MSRLSGAMQKRRRELRETQQRAKVVQTDRRKHKARRQARKKLLLRYDITEQDYQQRLQQQGGRCAICFKEPDEFRRLAVDHHHGTGMVRGLLCSYCNTGLGLFGDNVRRLFDAIQYLGGW